ncbi:MAG TPA: hypothetical protein VN704_02600 [Verrucomicrobiae bacterium]|nr:hypothetical protein [Verrucomicrobiae bacterium]
MSTSGCLYDHKYQTRLEGLLSFRLDTLDCTKDHEVPPYVFAAIGPFSSS